MEDLLNEAGNGSEDTVVSEKPISIRDSLKAAMTEAAETPEVIGDGKPRDQATGRFVQKEGERAATPAAQSPATPAQQPQTAQQAPTATTSAPVAAEGAHKAPPGWSPEAKAAFDTLPENVKAAVSKREEEIDKGFKVLQDYKGLEEFTPLIKQGNTTHADVMRKALDYEKFLQRDPIGTVLHVAQIGGVNIQALAQAIVEGKVQIPQQQAPVQQQQQRPQPQPVNVEATVEEVLRKRDTENQVQAFISDPANVHAEAVLEDMIALINAGRAGSLKDAYDAACWMRPDIRQQLISQAAPNPAPDLNAQRAAAADQARRASRSITGSAAPGPSASATPAQPSSIRDTLKQAIAAAGSRA
ncbi:hypothetical protein QO004_000466 [Rhizobium mesoamericanum]|uniref:hypothetical protein n=1 Tax=Rhizobium mesoamericanum TaxID=1079800 RepID=UPI002781E98F|nr:hypothetical protein [Rhizobium mesoamericanum]MDQ0558691.1 hypothetical protein [Rhizobium mesoamericanum]